MEDWSNLLEHALIADASPEFQDWLHHRSSWQWQPPPEQADHPEEALVREEPLRWYMLSAHAYTCIAICMSLVT